MFAARDKDQVTLRFNAYECAVLLRALRSLIQNYQAPPAEAASAAVQAWYSTRGCQSAGMTPAEIREWVAALHQYKSANLGLLERVQTRLQPGQTGRVEMTLSMQETAALLGALNDHRLFLAARHNVGDAEMSVRSASKLARMDSELQVALYEIHLLGWLVEELIGIVHPEAAQWNEEG